ncbi:MAG: HEAT repeat domain-containing protein, partial [Planctomycetota bacterium]
MDPFKLACLQCKKGYRIPEVIPGKVPPCRHCGTMLASLGALVFGCDACGHKTEPLEADLGRALLCERCNGPMKALEQKAPPSPLEGPRAPAPENRSQEKSEKKTSKILKDRASAESGGEKPEKAPAFDIPMRPPTLPLPNAESREDKEKTEPSLKNGVETGYRRLNFGKYRLLQEVGRGAMGIVYRAYDPDLRREVALKILLAGEGASVETLQRFLREARSAAKLQHPNIVPIHEVGEVEGQYYFTMDYIQGRSFHKIIEAGDMDSKTFLRHMRDICLALQAAHDLGIIHRDLKPGNILYDHKTRRPLLTDFGLAKDMRSESLQSITGAVFGTPAYMSPEQASGKTHLIDYRTDIYSMGVILYEGITGQQPFQGDTIYDTISMVVTDEPPAPHVIAPHMVDRDMETIILKCMEKDPANRYPQMFDLAEDLNAHLIGAPISARPLPLPLLLLCRLQHSTLAKALAIAAPLVLIILVLAFSFSMRKGYVQIAEQALKSGDPVREAGAVRELFAAVKEGRIKSDTDKKAALRLFRKAVLHQNPDTARLAVDASRFFKDAESLQPLMQVASDEALPTDRRTYALAAVAEIGPAALPGDKGLTQALTELARNKALPEPQRAAAIQGMSGVWHPSALQPLLELAQDTGEPSALRVAALQALGSRIVVGSKASYELIRLYTDDDKAVAQAAENAIESTRNRESLVDYYGLAGAALGKLGEIAHLSAQRNRRMEDILEEMDEAPTRGSAPPLTQIEAMVQRLRSPNPQERLDAAYDLGNLGNADALNPLLNALADPDPTVRKVAARSLVELAPKGRPDMNRLYALLSHEDFLVREQAIYVIGSMGGKDALPRLAEAATKETSGRAQAALAEAFAHLGDPRGIPVLGGLCDRASSPQTAIACVKALASFGEAGVEHLVHALTNPNQPVREAAAT